MNSLAFLGCAHIHTPGFIDEIKRRNLKVSYVYDHDPARAQMNAEKTGAQIAEIDTILADPEVKAVVVTSETNRHPELARAIAAARKPMFLEKPIGTDTAASRAIAEVVDQAGVVFHTGYRMRGEPVIRKIREHVHGGTFGQITRVRASVGHNGALGGWFDREWRWMADVEQAGVGAFGDLGTHVLDVLLWIFGEVEVATAILGMGTSRYEGCDECGEGLMRFKSGAIATMSSSWDDLSSPVRMEVSGTQAHAILVNNELRLTRNGQTETVTELGDAAPAGFSAFLEWFEDRPAELVSAREASYVDTVMDAMYVGHREGRWVPIEGSF